LGPFIALKDSKKKEEQHENAFPIALLSSWKSVAGDWLLRRGMRRSTGLYDCCPAYGKNIRSIAAGERKRN